MAVHLPVTPAGGRQQASAADWPLQQADSCRCGPVDSNSLSGPASPLSATRNGSYRNAIQQLALQAARGSRRRLHLSTTFHWYCKVVLFSHPLDATQDRGTLWLAYVAVQSDCHAMEHDGPIVVIHTINLSHSVNMESLSSSQWRIQVCSNGEPKGWIHDF